MAKGATRGLVRMPVELERLPRRRVEEFACRLADGGVMAIPTDTVYALACDLASRRGIERLYAAKGMDRRHPLAFLLPNLSDVARYAVVTDYAYRVMRRLLPGPFCVQLDATREVPRILMDKRRVVGIRVPDSQFVQSLLAALGRPILVSGATLPGTETPLADGDEIETHYGSSLDLIIDAGPLGDVPSTVISLVGDEFVLVRQGKGRID